MNSGQPGLQFDHFSLKCNYLIQRKSFGCHLYAPHWGGAKERHAALEAC